MSKPNRRTMILYTGVFILIPLFLGVLMCFRTQSMVRSYMETQVAAQAEILKGLASRRLSVRLGELERVADYLRDGALPEEKMGNTAAELLKDPNQLSFGIQRLDGTAVCGQPLDIKEYPCVQNAFRGRSAVRYRKGEGMLFVTPIYNNGNTKYALYEFYEGATLFEFFADYCFDGQCDLMLADFEHQITMPIWTDMTEGDSFFQDGRVVTAFERLTGRMVNDTSAAIYCKSAAGKDFIFVSEVGRSDLFLLGIIPYKAVAGGLLYLTPMVIVVFGLLQILLILGTFRVVDADARLRESDELRAAKKAAEEASESRGRFLASMSHELRTPINTIMGLNELTMRETEEKSTRERSMDIRSASQILLGLISDVLDFTKIESGQLKVIPMEYNLATMIRDLVLLSENRARAKSLEFRVAVQPNLPVGLYGDDIRIQQILTNLLTNAVKYTPEGSVLLRVTGTRNQAGDTLNLHCEVSDTGIGIRQEELPKLFKPFARADEERNRNIEGSGLGLSIITNLLQLMDSHLEVDSVYGQGSTFGFTLEQRIVDPEPIGDIQKRMSDMVQKYEYRVSCVAPRARILMVDDNAMNRKIFTSLLKPTQISVTTVSSGQRCLDIVQKERFDLIFMDHLMPKMDGVETLHRLKAMENNLCGDTPVIALTANAFSGAQERYMEMGFNGFLAKPVETEKLEATIRAMLPSEYVEDKPEPEPEKGPEEKLPMLEGVNWDYAKLHIRDPDLLLDALRDFYRSIGDEYRDISDMAGALGTEEGLTDYRIRVHSLKSTSALVGVMSVSELAKLLETAAREGQIERIHLLNPVLLEELLATEERLRPIAAEQVSKEPLEDMSQLLAMLDMLRMDMAAMDIGKADADMERLNGYSYDPDVQEEMDKLAGLVSGLDFDGAAEAVGRLMERFMDAARQDE